MNTEITSSFACFLKYIYRNCNLMNTEITSSFACFLEYIYPIISG